MSDDSDKRRESVRVEAAFRVTYPTVQRLVSAYTHDLSLGGVFVRTHRFLPLNAVLQLEIDLPEGGGLLKVISRVAYVRDEQDAAESGKPAGMGLSFLDLTGESARRIEQFIEERTGARTERVVAAPAARTRSVVVVDDDAHYRALAERVFVERGYPVRVAADGLAGLSMCLKDPPDLVVTDVQMPRMDGWQLLRFIRARPSLAGLPVIFVTTLGRDEERLRGYQLGVDDYVPKPYQPEELLARAEFILSRSGGTGRPQAERKTLRGDLAHVSLASMLSFLEVEKKTGVLLVISDVPARVFLADGRALKVEIDDAAPAAAPLDLMLQLLDWTEGQFEFAAQDVPMDDLLQTSVTALLLEHARRRDEARRR